MILYIKSKDEFDLWDLLHLNYDAIKMDWIDIKLPQENDEKEEHKTSVLKVEIKTEETDDKYTKSKKYKKIFDTLNLAVKLGKVQ